jgi:hypothetical protein
MLPQFGNLYSFLKNDIPLSVKKKKKQTWIHGYMDTSSLSDYHFQDLDEVHLIIWFE